MKDTSVSNRMQEYFDELEKTLHAEIDIASKARKKGLEPKPHIEIPLAKDLADRV
ncbi:MAG: hypothetical protein K8R19_02805, partial [Methanosarcinales archaeon]|nr:hypothetical protein [Methanosarcinales archaeon]